MIYDQLLKLLKTFSEDAGSVKAVRKQEKSSQKFLHPHHGLL